jgi:hypothetical protein
MPPGIEDVLIGKDVVGDDEIVDTPLLIRIRRRGLRAR